jgi:hypothetical protein
MIFDGENMFYNKADLTGTLTSDVVNVGPGETYQPMFLAIMVKDANDGATFSATLQTSADAAFTAPVTLATVTKAGSLPVPRGNLGYLRLQVSATATAGELTAGLVVDDDISHRQ